LKQALSACGVRYTDGRITLWTKGRGAFIERDGIVTHMDCSAVPVK
jgi:membrane-bound inhibitor of C-type lysozyme